MNAFLSCLVAAVNKKKAGEDVCLVIDEALAALADKKFRWSEEIQPHAETIKKETESRGPSEPEGLVKMAKDAGVPLYANLGWAKILAIAESLPEGLEPLELKDFLESLSKAKHVLCEHTVLSGICYERCERSIHLLTNSTTFSIIFLYSSSLSMLENVNLAFGW